MKRRIPKTVTLSVETFFLKLLTCELSFSACFKLSMRKSQAPLLAAHHLPLQQAKHHTPSQEGFMHWGREKAKVH